MPRLFNRSTFRTPRKPVRRKGGSLPNISQLDDTISSANLPLDGGPVTMKLGDHEFCFEDGQWALVSSGSHESPEDQDQLQRQYLKVLEENNLLRYKVELLVDMLAASSADCLVLQRELEAVKKVKAPAKK